MDWDDLVIELERARLFQRLVIPPSQRFNDFSLASAYQVGQRLSRRRVENGYSVAGRKIGLTNEAVWPRIGVEDPVWGPVYTEGVHSGEELLQTGFDLSPLFAPRLEAEVVVRLHEPLGVGASLEEVTSAIGSVALGFEIVDCHYPKWTFSPADLVADHGMHAALIIGPYQTVAHIGVESLANLSIDLNCDGEFIANGRGHAVLGGPAQAVTRVLATPFAENLHAGDVISTGALTGGAHQVGSGQVWTADTNMFPLLSVRFT